MSYHIKMPSRFPTPAIVPKHLHTHMSMC